MLWWAASGRQLQVSTSVELLVPYGVGGARFGTGARCVLMVARGRCGGKLILVLRCIEKTSTMRGYKMTLFCPSKDPNDEMWHGPRSGREGAVEVFGADEVRSSQGCVLRSGTDSRRSRRSISRSLPTDYEASSRNRLRPFPPRPYTLTYRASRPRRARDFARRRNPARSWSSSSRATRPTLIRTTSLP